jgi:hypothetical protein
LGNVPSVVENSTLVLLSTGAPVLSLSVAVMAKELAPFAGIESGLTEIVMLAVIPGSVPSPPPPPEPPPHEAERRETPIKRIMIRLN